jgi:hypothetical protein
LEKWLESKQPSPVTTSSPRPTLRIKHAKFSNDYVERLVESAKKEVLGENYQEKKIGKTQK